MFYSSAPYVIINAAVAGMMSLPLTLLARLRDPLHPSTGRRALTLAGVPIGEAATYIGCLGSRCFASRARILCRDPSHLSCHCLHRIVSSFPGTRRRSNRYQTSQSSSSEFPRSQPQRKRTIIEDYSRSALDSIIKPTGKTVHIVD